MTRLAKIFFSPAAGERLLQICYWLVVLAVVALLAGPWPHQRVALADRYFDGVLLIAGAAVLVAIPPVQWIIKPLTLAMMWLGKRRPAYMVGLMMALFFNLAAFATQHLFGGVPHVADAHAQYFHAKAFAEFRLGHPEPAQPDFFNFQTTGFRNNYWYSLYPPGYLVPLGIGHKLGFPWLVNPALGALTLLAVFLLAREITSRGVGYCAAALMLISPFILFMSAGFMNHATCAFFATLFLFFYIRQHKTSSWQYALLAGLSVGFAFITRPQTILFFALPVAVHAIASTCVAFRQRWRGALLMLAGFSLMVAFYLYYNTVLSGAPWLQGGADPTHYLKRFSDWEKINFQAHWARVNSYFYAYHDAMFGWKYGSLLFVLLLFVLRRAPRYAGLLMACVVAQYLGMFINPFSDQIYGPRYVYEISPVVVVLSACGLAAVASFLTGINRRVWPRRPTRAILCVCVTVFFCMALRGEYQWRYNLYRDHYWEGNKDLYEYMMQATEKPAIVFFPNYKEYRLFFFMQPPAADSPVIIARDLWRRNRTLAEQYPGRYLYIFRDGVLHRAGE